MIFTQRVVKITKASVHNKQKVRDTVVAKMIRILVFSPAKNGLYQLFLSFAVVCQ